jgi:hypothetical protein
MPGIKLDRTPLPTPNSPSSRNRAALNNPSVQVVSGYPTGPREQLDIFFSADVETDGPIPGPYSLLSFGLVYAGAYDGQTFFRPPSYDENFYVELKPISERYEQEALDVNGLDRGYLTKHGDEPGLAMTEAASWVRKRSSGGSPVIVAYPLSFDWLWLYWYFVQYSRTGSPFGYSRGFDVKTAMAVKLRRTLSSSGRKDLPESLKSHAPHTHNALDDAVEQAEIFANVFTAGWVDG